MAKSYVRKAFASPASYMQKMQYYDGNFTNFDKATKIKYIAVSNKSNKIS